MLILLSVVFKKHVFNKYKQRFMAPEPTSDRGEQHTECTQDHWRWRFAWHFRNFLSVDFTLAHLRSKEYLFATCLSSFLIFSSHLMLQLTVVVPPGGYSPEILVGVWARSRLKPLPYFRHKYAIFHTLFQTWPKLHRPISDLDLTLFRLVKHFRASLNSRR